VNVRVTEAVPEAVNYVFDNLWERGGQELAILGYSVDQARAIVTHQRLSGAPTLAVWIDGAPALICGLMRTDSPDGMATWFQATEAFTEHARQITKELRAKLEGAATTYNLKFIEIVSPCVHPKTGRWFAALGFRLDVDRHIRARDDLQQRLYRFERRFDHVLPEA
jgi:hypothetical protein